MGKKIRGVSVTGDLVAVVIPPNVIPSTARFQHAYFDYERNVFVCLFEDESFEAIPEGCRFPIDVPCLDGYSKTTWHYIDRNGDPVTTEEYAAHVASATP